MKKWIIVLMAVGLLTSSKKMFADPETGGKTHACIWIYVTPQQAVLKCDGSGSMCGAGSDCVKS